MDKKKIHELSDKINQQNRNEFSVSELSIIVQSQFYNIEDLYNYLVGDEGIDYMKYIEDIEHFIKLSSKIISISEAFMRNIVKFPTTFSWNDKDQQVVKVKEILENVKMIKIDLEDFLLENKK